MKDWGLFFNAFMHNLLKERGDTPAFSCCPKGPKGEPGVPPMYNEDCIFYAQDGDGKGNPIPMCDYSDERLSGCECRDCKRCITTQDVPDKNARYILLHYLAKRYRRNKWI